MLTFGRLILGPKAVRKLHKLITDAPKGRYYYELLTFYTSRGKLRVTQTVGAGRSYEINSEGLVVNLDMNTHRGGEIADDILRLCQRVLKC